MDRLTIFCQLLFLCFNPTAATSLITADVLEARGQRVCKAGKGRPCYKLAYFSELRRRLNFGEAELACRRDGGQLLSVASASEQKLIEQLITDLRPTDGDFWIGLRRNHGDEDSSGSSDCSSQYRWLDGSKSTFRNWHWDEPSCGYEVCVVMYHQPSAPPGMGGLYMFQWNDDNCETKHNFICKYTAGKSADPSPPNSTHADIFPSSVPWNPSDHNAKKSTALNVIYIIIPTIPLILLLLTVTGVCCFKMLVTRRRKEQKSEVPQPDPGHRPSTTPTDVYNVIRSQKDDDLVSARPHTKNTSFLCSSPDTPTGDYDNLGGRDTESGFVTLASTESCFLNFDLNDLSLGRRGSRDLYNSSLGRPAKRDLTDGGLGRPSQFYDRSLGRRTTKSEHFGCSRAYGDHELYEDSVTAKSDLYDLNVKSGGHTVKADMYQTYTTNGKMDSYQSILGTYGSRKSYQATLDSYRSALNFDGGRRYFNEQHWLDSEKY
ncbi:layilin isoform X1 [Dunckerocampus dactyliophorus]|uniref:layilin isoform X1 n=1 Tax=Dunckerocampus dactyliophorus TaxID=161453 RepID=UPI002405C2BA|nr:layilin isoform X1 [Dunckerocampus dactyliophorus]